MNKPVVHLLGLCALLPAVAGAGNFRYSFVDAAYVHSDFDDAGTDGDGYRVSGSVEVHENVFVFANYKDVDLDGAFDPSLSRLNAGAGLNIGLGKLPADAVFKAGYVDAEVETDFGDVDDNGFAGSAGVRIKPFSRLELEGNFNYFDLDAFDDTTFDVSGRLYLTNAIAIQAGTEFDEEIDNVTYNAGVRAEFGD
jgi:hypothetical protein